MQQSAMITGRCEGTGKKWSDFAQMKSDMVEKTCEHLNKLKSWNISVQYIQLDSSGKNQTLAKHAASINWAILQPLDFEFISHDTPQHNSLVKLAFSYIAGKACTMMGGALVPDDL